MLTTVEATPEDEAFLYDVYCSTRKEEVSCWGWGNDELDAFFRMQFHCQRRSYESQYPHARQKIVWNQGVRVGRIIVGETAQEMRLIDISLLPEYRSIGIGTTLLKELKDAAATCGKPIRLHVLRSNRALSLYERNGFRICGGDEPYAAMECRCR